ncbi:MAG: precorrin-3B C(17)-methyltransferase [Candidatus Omnitrophica bacterium]|nr:precorrin-3B C(17)-methyltransferase [Candidatus Omnitrophota bacterium]
MVGIGPGASDHLSQKAREVIAESQVIVGYNAYIKLLDNLAAGKEVISTGMTKEIDRAIQAIEKASAGKKVCIISSGDSGIYGMAAVILELLKKNDAKKIKIEIIPGITAASACASLLGAPLAQDFAVISLSDLLVGRKTIEKKIKAALNGNFVIVLYNPKSKSRIKPLEMAWNIIKKSRPLMTPVGIVKNAYRAKEDIKLITLKKAALLKDIDMATTIIIGNSETFIKDNRYMITKRGYNIKR